MLPRSAASAHPPVLADFGRFWEIEHSPAERRKLLASLFERGWEDAGVIVAVKPRAAFARYFRAADDARHREENCGAEGGSDGGSNPRFTPRIEIRL